MEEEEKDTPVYKYRTGTDSTKMTDGFMTDIYIENSKNKQGALFQAMICPNLGVDLILHESHATRIGIDLNDSAMKVTKIDVRGYPIVVKELSEDHELDCFIPIHKDGENEIFEARDAAIYNYIHMNELPSILDSNFVFIGEYLLSALSLCPNMDPDAPSYCIFGHFTGEGLVPWEKTSAEDLRYQQH